MLAYIRQATKNNDEGASAVEYGLLVAAIAAVIILLVFVLGGWVRGAFKDTCESFNKSGTNYAAKGTVAKDCTQ